MSICRGATHNRRIGSRALAVVSVALKKQPHGDSSHIEALLAAAKLSSHAIPSWLEAELRTNHAGEYGAVEIYRGALYGAYQCFIS